MRIKVNKKQIKQIEKTYKVLREAAPIALLLAEAVLPQSKAVRKVSKILKTLP